MIEEVEPFALAGVIVTEILQRSSDGMSIRMEHFLSMWELLEPRGFSTSPRGILDFAAGSVERHRLENH